MHRLLSDNRETIVELCKRFHVSRLDVFGSAAAGGFDPARSDVDLLVEFDDAMPIRRFRAYFGLKAELEALLGRKVDLVEPGGIRNAYYKRGIEATREQLYAA
ncbi:MAG: nucleotidyltransferase family protein [Phycisphaeraceae bacterium]